MVVTNANRQAEKSLQTGCLGSHLRADSRQSGARFNLADYLRPCLRQSGKFAIPPEKAFIFYVWVAIGDSSAMLSTCKPSYVVLIKCRPNFDQKINIIMEESTNQQVSFRSVDDVSENPNQISTVEHELLIGSCNTIIDYCKPC